MANTSIPKGAKVFNVVRADLSNKVKHMNAVLTKAKDQFASLKKVIKGNYLQEEWQRFGIQDKR